MKRLIIIISAAVVIAGGLNGCKRQNEMTMTLEHDGEVEICIGGAETVTINWGDGSERETYKYEHEELYADDGTTHCIVYRHVYSTASTRTITITGNNITHFSCSRNQIKNLDVSKNTSLTLLDCSNNQFSESELNGLFETLHCNDIEGGKYIIVSDNPGTDDCNMSIAEDKGWTVVYLRTR